MIPAINITQDDIGTSVRALVKGKYLHSYVVGIHRDKYVVYCTDTGRYESTTMKYLEDGNGLEEKIVDILKDDSCTVFPADIVADYIWDRQSINVDYESVEGILKNLSEDENSNVEYHIPSGGYLYVP